MFSATDQRGGNMTKSHMATPSFAEGQVNTVNMLGSWNVASKAVHQLRDLFLLFPA